MNDSRLSDAILGLLRKLNLCICLNSDTGKYEAQDRNHQVVAEFDDYAQIIRYAEEHDAAGRSNH